MQTYHIIPSYVHISLAHASQRYPVLTFVPNLPSISCTFPEPALQLVRFIPQIQHSTVQRRHGCESYSFLLSCQLIIYLGIRMLFQQVQAKEVL